MKIKELKKRRDRKLIKSLYSDLKELTELDKIIVEVYHKITMII